MKNKKNIILLIVVGLFTMSFGIKFMSGGFGDSTGAPLKGTIVASYQGCNSTNCHTGKPLNDFTKAYVDVISDIPLTGWVPSATYNLTVTTTAPSKLAFGFQLTAWGKIDSVTRGTLTAINADVAIKKSILRNAFFAKVDSNYYATHKTTSVAHGSSDNQWTLQWTAPPVKNQEIRFYLTAVCANANGSSLGDNVYRINKNADSSSIAYPNVNAVGINEYSNTEKVLVYPTITSNNVTVTVPASIEQATIYVTDISGKIVLKQLVNPNDKSCILNLSDFETGNYIVTIQSVNYNYSKKIVKI
jgi:hypothetical protein